VKKYAHISQYVITLKSNFSKNYGVTTHVVRLKLFRLKAEGVRKARLPYFGGNI